MYKSLKLEEGRFIMIPFQVLTLESYSKAVKRRNLQPRDNDLRFFQVEDPFGLRKAIVPMFWLEEDRTFTGLGSAFALDQWGGLVTADHVIADARLRGRLEHEKDGSVTMALDGEIGLVALLGYGMVMGTVAIPKGAMVHITNTTSPAVKGTDPLAALQGRHDLRSIDIASMRFDPVGRKELQNLPIRLKPPLPKIGDDVVALGYPGLRVENNPRINVDVSIVDVLAAAYGKVTKLYPEGRDMSNVTPVFEVSAYWPSGMSGGPVFNADGEVVGIVSRSIIDQNAERSGVGWATMLGEVPALNAWLPSLAHEGPDYRSGWTTSSYGRESPIYYRTEEDAQKAAAMLGKNIKIYRSEHKIGGIESLVYERW